MGAKPFSLLGQTNTAYWWFTVDPPEKVSDVSRRLMPSVGSVSNLVDVKGSGTTTETVPSEIGTAKFGILRMDCPSNTPTLIIWFDEGLISKRMACMTVPNPAYKR
jgi:hypothetical protein